MTKENINFLESITFFGNDVLIPVKDIQWIMARVNENGDYEITIKGQEKNEWVEHFSPKEKARFDKRYAMIKKLVNAG